MPVRITVEIDGAIRATRSNHSTSYVHAESEVVEVVVHTKETVAMLKRAISAKLIRPPADPVNGLNLHRTLCINMVCYGLIWFMSLWYNGLMGLWFISEPQIEVYMHVYKTRFISSHIFSSLTLCLTLAMNPPPPISIYTYVPFCRI